MSFQSLILETISLHNAEVVAHFSGLPASPITITGVTHIYDATPKIETVDASQSPALIYGSNFGASGTVVVCALPTSSSPCSQTPDINVGPVLWGSIISAVLIPQVMTLGSTHCVQVQSNGASGSTFLGAASPQHAKYFTIRFNHLGGFTIWQKNLKA